MDPRPSREATWRRIGVVSWSLIGVAVLGLGVLWLLDRLRHALVPFLLALVIVYLLRRSVSKLATRGLPRALAVLVCYLGAAAIVAVLAVFIVPLVVEQVTGFVSAFPQYYDRAYGLWADLGKRYVALSLPAWAERLGLEARAVVSQRFMGWSSSLARGAFAAGGQVVTLLFDGLLALVLAFYTLKDLPVLREEILSLAGPHGRDEAQVVFSKVSAALSGYLRGQIIISASTGALSAVALSIVGVPYALVIGLLNGVLNVVPYAGPALGATIAAIAAAFVHPLLAVWAVLAIFVVQQVNDLILAPRIMSRQVDLHPLLVVFSLLAGATLFGFVGVLMAIPVAAVAKGMFVYYFEKNTAATLGTEDGALFRQVKDDGRPDDDPSSDET
ncbi:MAG: AI-2E family transporter [Coriobacteriia bacterium]